MTCIVGLACNGTVWMGGDSAAIGEGYELARRAEPKVFRAGEMMIGFSNSFRFGQLLRYKFRPPPIGSLEPAAYLVTTFVDAMRGTPGLTLSDGDLPGVILVGLRGRLFRIDVDFSIGETVEGFDACGCGDGYALGSLHTSRMAMEPRERVRLALDAAAAFSGGVSPPFTILDLPLGSGRRRRDGVALVA